MQHAKICSLIRLLSSFLFLGAMAGCGAMPPVDKSAPLNRSTGHVFGSFKLQGITGGCALRIGLALKRTGSSDEYVIEFQGGEPVAVFEVRPGRYEIAQVVFKTCEGIESGGRKEFRSVLVAGEFDVPAMTAVYIGNYEARVGAATAPSGLGTTFTQRWRVTSACRDFDGISNRFATDWPKLAELRKIDVTRLGPLCGP